MQYYYPICCSAPRGASNSPTHDAAFHLNVEILYNIHLIYCNIIIHMCTDEITRDWTLLFLEKSLIVFKKNISRLF